MWLRKFSTKIAVAKVSPNNFFSCSCCPPLAVLLLLKTPNSCCPPLAQDSKLLLPSLAQDSALLLLSTPFFFSRRRSGLTIKPYLPFNRSPITKNTCCILLMYLLLMFYKLSNSNFPFRNDFKKIHTWLKLGSIGFIGTQRSFPKISFQGFSLDINQEEIFNFA